MHRFLAAMILAALAIASPALAQTIPSYSYPSAGTPPTVQLQCSNTYDNCRPITSSNPVPTAAVSAGVLASSSTTSGTVATANTYQSVLAASATRNGCLIQNRSSDTLKAYLGSPGSATDAASIAIPVNGSLSCNAPGLVVTDQISLTGPNAGDAYVVVSQ